MAYFISFNINGIRARMHQIQALSQISLGVLPDVVGLQETKVHDEAFPVAEVEKLGYHVTFFGQKAHYGVAFLSQSVPIFVQKGFLGEASDAQKRLIHAQFDVGGRVIDVINGYFPQGENQSHATKFPMKRAFYQSLTDYVIDLKKDNKSLIVMGDMNIAPQDKDVGLGEVNAKRWLLQGACSFLPEEREWYQRLLAVPLYDTFRHLHPQDESLSWFDYRSKGFDDTPKRGLRIDHILCTSDLLPNLVQAGISYQLRGMEKPSDHAPVWAKFAWS